MGAKINALKVSLSTANVKAIGKAVENKESFQIDVEGETLTLQHDEVLCAKKMSETYYLAQDKELAVVLDITITEELQVEGAMRDIVRQLQNMRKEADFQVSDNIKVRYTTEDSLLQKALHTHKDYICQETLCKELLSETPKGDLVKELTISNGNIVFAVEKI